MLQVGQPAPAFTLPDASMEMMSLSSYRGKKNVVLYFYPKDGTPGCTIQAIDFSDREKEFQRLDTVIFGVSRDDVLSHDAFRDEHGLTVQLLADTEEEVCKMYDVLAEKTYEGRNKTMVRRSTFVIDPSGVVSRAYYNVKATGHVARLRKELGL